EPRELVPGMEGFDLCYGCLSFTVNADPPFSLRSDMLVQGLPEFPLSSLPAALHHRRIGLFHFTFAKHPVQLDERAALLGDDEKARGIAVEPVRELQHLRLRP